MNNNLRRSVRAVRRNLITHRNMNLVMATKKQLRMSMQVKSALNNNTKEEDDEGYADGHGHEHDSGDGNGY